MKLYLNMWLSAVDGGGEAQDARDVLFTYLLHSLSSL